MSSLTIGRKLYLGTGALVIFTFALGLTALQNANSIGDRVHTIVDKTVVKQTLAHTMSTDASDLLAEDRGILVRGYMKDLATIDKYNQQFAATADDLQNAITTALPLIVKPEVRQAVQEVQDALAPMQDANRQVYEAAKAGDMDKATQVYNDLLLPAQKRQKAAVLTVLKTQDELMAADAKDSYDAIGSNRSMTGAMLSLACIVGIALIFVVRQINALLRNSVAELGQASDQIASAANQVSSSSQSLAQGSSEQAATIEETSSASAEINSMARRNTENSHAAAEAVTRSQAGYEKTNVSIAEMVDAMEGINASSQKISKIIKVIDEIAFQTNILALNAAVEAARAGEAGMGFAVVADEVRNLAQRCAQAAKDTADLIEESIQKSDGGRVKVEQVASAIREITAEAGKIKVLVEEINQGSVEQTGGIDQISRAITQMEQVTQSSAANAEQSAAAAEQLNAQAEAMKDVVEGLRVMVDGGAGARRGTAARAGIRATPANAQWSTV